MWLDAMIIAAAAVSVASASHNKFTTVNSKRSIVCQNPVQGLLREDCEYMRSIDVSEMGINDFSNNARIWIGDDGSNKLTFTNRADVPVTLMIWHNAAFQSSFVRARQPYVTYSLPNTGDSVVNSVGGSVSGGFAALYDRTTTLSQYGQVYNTWGEFTSGPYATINVSREPNIRGNSMEIRTGGGGCVSNMNICVLRCMSGNSCWQDNRYYLQNYEAQAGNLRFGCDANGQPQGGCGGWENGGVVQIDLFN